MTVLLHQLIVLTEVCLYLKVNTRLVSKLNTSLVTVFDDLEKYPKTVIIQKKFKQVEFTMKLEL